MHRPAYTTPSPVPWRPSPAPVAPMRRRTARVLRRAGAALRWVAARLVRPAPGPARHVPMSLPRLEYHADAGAPEGALYVDGEYVGHLDVTRL